MHAPYHETKKAQLLAGATDAKDRLKLGLASRKSNFGGLPTKTQLLYWARQLDVRAMLADGHSAAASRLLDTIQGVVR